MTNLRALWPQDHINVDCLVAISMDISAPFLADMGLLPEGMGPFRDAFRQRIDEQPQILAHEVDELAWLGRLDGLLQTRVPDYVRQHFWSWVKDTFTYVPADRPNWERYETFFSQWSVGMRTGKDNAECFTDAKGVYAAYYSFVPARGLKQRIRNARGSELSAWDERMFSLRRYSFDQEDVDPGEHPDPFGVIEATAERNYFQQFWEFLYPRLSNDERRGLYDAMWKYYGRWSFLKELLPPDRLTRRAR